MTGLMTKSDEMMTKEDMKAFIRTTVDEIMTEINKNMETTIEIKIKEKTDSMKKDIKQLNKDIELLRNENSKLKKDLSEAEKKNNETDKIAKQSLRYSMSMVPSTGKQQVVKDFGSISTMTLVS